MHVVIFTMSMFSKPVSRVTWYGGKWSKTKQSALFLELVPVSWVRISKGEAKNIYFLYKHTWWFLGSGKFGKCWRTFCQPCGQCWEEDGGNEADSCAFPHYLRNTNHEGEKGMLGIIHVGGVVPREGTSPSCPLPFSLPLSACVGVESLSWTWINTHCWMSGHSGGRKE